MKKLSMCITAVLLLTVVLASCKKHDMEDYTPMSLDRMTLTYLANSTWDITTSELDDGVIKKGKYLVFAPDTMATSLFTPQKDRCDVVKYKLGQYANAMLPCRIGIRDTMTVVSENGARTLESYIRYYQGQLRDMTVQGGTATMSFEILFHPGSEQWMETGFGSVIVLKRRR